MKKVSLPVIQENAGEVKKTLGELFPAKKNDWSDFVPPRIEPIKTDKEYVSFSELSTWMDCSWKHKVKYLDNIKLDKPTEHTEFGQVIHDALETYLSTRQMPDVESVKEIATRRFDALDPSIKSKLKAKDWQEQIPSILSSVPSFLTEKFGEWQYVSAEFELMEEIVGHSRKFHGYIDGIIKTPKKARKNAKTKPDGFDYYVIDWKVTSWGWTLDKKIDDKKTFQLILYKYFWSKKLGIDPKDIKTAFVLLKRTSKDPQRCELVSVSSTPAQTEKAVKTVENMLLYVKKGLYTKNKESCKFCPYNKTEYCP